MADRTTNHARLAGILSVAGAYIWFLLFAQYGFLHLLGEHLSADALRPVMAIMGIAGLGASLLTGWLLGRHSPQRLTRIGFLICAATSTLALAAGSLLALDVVAALIGLGLEVLTVSLATALRGLGAGGQPALLAGLGTGIAYFVCNIPPLFNGSTATIAIAVTVAAVIGLAATWLPSRRFEPPPLHAAPRELCRDDFRGLGFAGITIALAALVWFDSAAFYVIQESLQLKGITWGTPAREWTQGVVHLVIAVLAGWLIARGWFRSLLPTTFLLFLAGFAVLSASDGWLNLGGALYAGGISIYSTALVAFPSLHREEKGLLPIRWRAALLFGGAGWLGSAMGIGMAQDLHRVPWAFLWLSGAAIAIVWLYRILPTDRLRQPLLRAAAVAALLLLVGAAASRSRTPDGTDPVARGRRVYIEEGCLHCHSQYVRPDTRDVAQWGPFRPFDREERPVLIGNRRQGPDLLNAGNRRSEEWHRLHLRDPQAVSPGSRMPAYEHLFSDSTRGDDLVAYLMSLGKSTAAERRRIEQAWRLPDDVTPISLGAARGLYQESCAQCHGADANGDGPLAGSFERPPRPLAGDDLAFVPRALPSDVRRHILSRIVKYGIPGTSMPGHEYLRDEEIAGLTDYLLQLQATSLTTGKDRP